MADSSDDATRELIECLYGAMDKQDTSTFDALVSSRVVVEVGSSAPAGLEQRRTHLQEIYLGFPDGRHVIEELLVAGSHGISRCRFVGTHTGEFQGRTATGKKVSVAVIHKTDSRATRSWGSERRWTCAVYWRSSMAIRGACAKLTLVMTP